MEITKSILSRKKNYHPPQNNSNDYTKPTNENIATMSGFSFVTRRAHNRAAMEKPVLTRRDKITK